MEKALVRHLRQLSIVLLTLSLLMACAAAHATKAYAHVDHYVDATFTLKDHDTGQNKNSGSTITVHKDNKSSSYKYDETVNGPGYSYKYADNTYSANTYTGHTWDNLSMPHLFSAGSPASIWQDPHSYAMQIDPPKEYMTQPTMHMTLKRTSLINADPIVKFAFDGSFYQYLSAWPKASIWQKKAESSFRRGTVYTYGESVEFSLKRKRIKSLKLELSNGLSSGYTFELEPTGATPGRSMTFPGSGNVRSASADVVVGTYDLVVRDSEQTVRKRYPLTIEPLRIPRNNSWNRPDECISLDPGLRWSQAGYSPKEVEYMRSALSNAGAQYSMTSPFPYNSKIAATENYWARITIPANGNELTEKEPTNKGTALTDHVLKLNFCELTIKKEWQGSGAPDAVSITCRSNANGSRDLALSSSNGWQQRVSANASEVFTFTESNVDGFAPTEWRLARANAGANDGVKLPMSKDGKTAKLDLQNGTGVEPESSMSAQDLQKAKEIVAAGDAVLTVKNAKVKVFSVEKKWAIDGLQQDRPAKITVALQKKDGLLDTALKRWNTVETLELSSANSWKADFAPVPDEGFSLVKQYRIRELDEAGKTTVWAQGDADAPETKSLLERLSDWDQLWQQDDLTDYIKGNVKTKYVPTVVYNVSGVSVSGSGVQGPHKTKYYVTYDVSGDTTTITNTAVVDVSIYKRWLMFGSSKKPESVNLMLFGRDKSIVNAASDAGAAKPYLPVTSALYGDTLQASDIAGIVGLKSVLKKIPGYETIEKKIDDWVKIGLAVGKAKANDKNSLTGWRVKFGVKKYSALGVEQEFLGAELVTGLIKIGADTLTGFSFPAMLQPLSPRYLTVYGKAYKVPVLCKDYERTANVINTWLSINSNPQVAIGGTKHWEGDEVKDRPKEVTLHIYQKIRDKNGNIEKDASGQDKKKECKGSPIKIKASNGWTWSFAIEKEKNQDPKQAVKQEDLSIEEEVPQGYTVRYEGFDIFNKKDGSQTITVKGTKTWDDNNDAQKKRPSSITIRLYEKVKDSEDEPTQKESRTVTADGGWKWAFNNLPKTKKVDGKDKEIVYSIKEDKVEGYETKVNGYNVTNTLTQQGITIKVNKQWEGAPADYTYPQSITVRLYEKVEGSDGEPTEKDMRQVTKGEDGTWTCAFTGLPKTKKVDNVDKNILYSIKEDAVPDFSTQVSQPQVEGNTHTYTITNTYTNKTCVHVEKEWDNEFDNTGNLTPDKVTVKLYADGEPSSEAPLELSEANNWHGDFTDLDKTKQVDGKDQQIVYTVQEEPIDNWKPFVDGSAQEGFVITNVYDPNTMDLTVKVEWDDYNNKDGIRPEQVQCYLIADGAVVKDGRQPRYLSLTASNEWTATYTNLPVKSADDGHEISYRVRAQRRDPLNGNGYENSYTVAENHSSIDDGYVFITCRHTPQDVEIHGTKVWDDKGNEHNRPTTIKLKLLTDGAVKNPDTDVQELANWDAPDESGGISWTFGNRPLYRIDESTGLQRPISYVVVEEPVKDYKTTFEGNIRSGFTITNTYDPATTNVTVVAYWDDQDDLDGMRPKTVNVFLMSEDGKIISNKPVALTAEGGWTGTFKDLPTYDGDGTTPLTYWVHVQRTDMIGGDIKPYQVYELEKGKAIDGVAVVKLVHEPQTTSVKVTKKWEHGNAPDDVRPQNITLNLFANGQQIQSMTIGKTTPDGDPLPDDSWSYTFDNLRKHDTEGNNIFYTVSEEPVQDYTATYEHTYTAQANEYTITNTYDPNTTSLLVSALIDDQDNADGIRPSQLRVFLLADGKVAKDNNNQPITVVLNQANDWAALFNNLPRRDEHNEGIVYTAWVQRNVEAGIGPKDGPGTYAVWEENYANLAFVNLKHTPERVDILGTKVWNDEGHESERPDSITLRLIAEYEADTQHVKQEVDTIVVTDQDMDADGNWEWAFEDKPAYAPGAGYNAQPILYSVTEDTVPNYESAVDPSDNDRNSWTVTNTYIGDRTLTVSGVWEDEGDADGIRPKEVTVLLLADGQVVTGKTYPVTLTLNEENGWTGTFTNLPAKNEDGEDIVYTARVQRNAWVGLGPVDGPGSYSVAESNSGDVGGDYTHVTFRHTPQRVEIPVVKIWDDDQNEDNVRPSSITVRLLANGSEVDHATMTQADANEEGMWEHTFEGKPAYVGAGEAMQTIDYTVEEDVVDSYDTHVLRHDLYEWTIVNSHDATQTEVTVQTVWDDQDNSMGIRPQSTAVRLMAAVKYEGTDVSFEVDEQNTTQDTGWNCTFDGLLRYMDESEVTYGIESDEVKGYTTTISGDATNGFVVRHVLDNGPQTVAVSGRKHWEDDENAYGKRPESIVVYLLANGAVVDSQTVSAAEDWAWEFKDLPAEASGEEIQYTVAEGHVPNYDVDVTGYDIVNTIDPTFIRTSVRVSKVWADEENPDARPEQVIVYLLADGSIVGSKTLSGDEWTATFDDLPLFDDDYNVVDYTVAEGRVQGYDATVEGNQHDGFVITNTLDTPEPESEKVSVEGKKTWVGGQKDNIVVYLLANDVEVVDKREVGDEDGWAWKFDDLPKTEDEQEVSYRVVEEGIEGYDATYDGYNITNTLDEEPPAQTVSIEGSKTWDDYDNTLNTRPQSIAVYVLADGEEVVASKSVTAEDGWAWKFEGLPKMDNGAEIEYTIAEGKVDGYSTTIDGYNITNKVLQEPVELLPALHDPPVQKKIEGDTPAKNSTFTFVLTPNDESYPMPDGKTGGSKEMSISGAGSGEFGIIEFGAAGTYEYTVFEKNTGETGYGYDESTYTIRYEVADEDANGDGRCDCVRTFLRDGEVVDGMTSASFTNTYKAPEEDQTPPPTPVQTSTPPAAASVQSERVAVPNTADPSVSVGTLASAGAALIVLGRRRARSSTKA